MIDTQHTAIKVCLNLNLLLHLFFCQECAGLFFLFSTFFSGIINIDINILYLYIYVYCLYL